MTCTVQAALVGNAHATELTVPGSQTLLFERVLVRNNEKQAFTPTVHSVHAACRRRSRRLLQLSVSEGSVRRPLQARQDRAASSWSGSCSTSASSR
jgi:hypothetical protein